MPQWNVAAISAAISGGAEYIAKVGIVCRVPLWHTLRFIPWPIPDMILHHFDIVLFIY